MPPKKEARKSISSQTFKNSSAEDQREVEENQRESEENQREAEENQRKVERNRREVEEHAWRVAKLAAILANRIPLLPTFSEDSDGVTREAYFSWDDSPYNIARETEDRIYLGCLHRANFLINNVPGANNRVVLAEDLFAPEKAYNTESIAARFVDSGWPNMKTSSVRGWLSETKKVVDSMVEHLTAARRNKWTDPLMCLQSALHHPSGYIAHTVFSLARKIEINSGKLQVDRQKLRNPPPPQVPDQLRPQNLLGVLKSHYQALLKIASPWEVVLVTGNSVHITHAPACQHPGCDSSLGKESMEETREQYDIGPSKIELLGKRFTSVCPDHHRTSPPTWPACLDPKIRQ